MIFARCGDLSHRARMILGDQSKKVGLGAEVKQQTNFAPRSTKVVEELLSVGGRQLDARLDLHNDSTFDQKIDSEKTDDDTLVLYVDGRFLFDFQPSRPQLCDQRS